MRHAAITPEQFSTFGELLKYLRRQARITQRELAIAVGYSDTQISRMEQNQRVPDSATITALFVPALYIEQEPKWVTRLLELSQSARLDNVRVTDGNGKPDTLHNLPIQLTSFIGREREISEVSHLIKTHHLVTLTGSGGTGKTRLSLQVASELLASFPDGVWLAEFAPLSDPALVPFTLANLFGLRESGESKPSIAQALVEYFRRRKVLIIFDNCEHLIEACARLADLLLQSCGNLYILASSREALGVRGELAYRVPSLDIPEATADMDSLMKSESARLFVERALDVSPDFSLTPKNASTVAQICSRLDGIPLALELAAARVKVLKVEDLEKRLDDRFHVLTGGSRTALPRQQTLRATIDWSYDLLSEAERALLRRLSVFAGGWTLSAAEAICAGDGIEIFEILDLLSKLMDKSLVAANDQNGQFRYRLLETVRQYGSEMLIEQGERKQLQDSHLTYFMGWAEEVMPKLRGPEQILWWDLIETDHDNIRTALDWSLSGGDVESGLRLSSSACWFWSTQGYFVEGLRWLQTFLAKTVPEKRTYWRAKALFGVGHLLMDRGDYTAAKAVLQEALGIWREQGDGWWISLTLVESGWQSLYQRDVDTALMLFREAEDVAKNVSDKWALANALRGLGAAIQRFDYSAARPVLEESIAIWRGIGDRVGLAEALLQMGSVAHGQKNYERAAMFSAESLALSRQTGSKSDISTQLLILGYTLCRQGDNAKAEQFLREGLSLAQELGVIAEIALSLVGLGGVAGGQKEPERAARLFGAAESILKELGMDMSVWPQLLDNYNDWAAAARAQLGEAAFAAAFADGRAMTLEQAVKYALEVTQ